MKRKGRSSEQIFFGGQAGTNRGEADAALHADIQGVFDEYGVQIMSPSYEYDPGEPKVVPREIWYPAPAKPS